MPSFLNSFRATRWLRTLNLILQAGLVLTLVGGLNYLADNHPVRLDLTRYRSFSLSPETLSYIKDLPRPVRIVVTLNAEATNPEVRGLLQEYRLATESNRDGTIKVDYNFTAPPAAKTANPSATPSSANRSSPPRCSMFPAPSGKKSTFSAVTGNSAPRTPTPIAGSRLCAISFV
ncbi:MAG: hypothetical protein NTZ29_09230 [Verrucomicrobia bacterium]|nr:hypothetical protein [Verrucomicrobiota bacterium]